MKLEIYDGPNGIRAEVEALRDQLGIVSPESHKENKLEGEEEDEQNDR